MDIMSTNVREHSEFKDGVHYEITEKGGRSYYVCSKCGRYFPRVYDTERSVFAKQHETQQLMALWAWHNFERHLKKCIKKKEFYGPCLPQRKRHYFGQNTGWAGGWGISWTYKCVWCGKYNPKWKLKFWEEEND